MEEDNQNYSQTVMFRGTPCNKICFTKLFKENCHIF